jgi:L-threonylcarbamoyladenylate synthase
MPQVSQTELIAAAVAGKVVSFPTDTVPALAARPESAHLIFAAKQRPPDKPLILMAASARDLSPYINFTEEILPIWDKLTQKYWPGALTLVLPSSNLVPVSMHPTDATSIGVRVPDCLVALEILQQTGALATTSANISGAAPRQTMPEIAAAFPDVLVLAEAELGDRAKPGSGLPSTVVKWTGKDWQILRQGAVSWILDFRF